MGWRRSLVILHRDVGYLSVGMALAYAISGFAVNHRQDWNYNQSRQAVSTQVGVPGALLATLPAERRAAITADLDAMTGAEQALLVAALGKALGRARPPRAAFWRGADRLSLFYGEGERDTVDYRPSTGVAEHIVLRDRRLLRDLNFLHLNEGRRLWTYIADIFAVALAFLALSGAVMLRGPRGRFGRRGVLVAAGAAVPLLSLLWLRWS